MIFYCFCIVNRGFMTANGQPDNARAARYVLKDFINGKLLYCHAPVNCEQSGYHTWPERQKIVLLERVVPPREARAVKGFKTTTEDLDRVFFDARSRGIHAKGKVGVLNNPGTSSEVNSTEKPWKKQNKHGNKNKKEKLRRVYAHLDQH